MGQREDKKGKGKKSPLYISDKEYGVDVGDPESSFRSIVGESSSSGGPPSRETASPQSFAQSGSSQEHSGAGEEEEPSTPELGSSRSHTRHLSHEEFHELFRQSSYSNLELSRPSLLIHREEKPGHHRRRSVNPLERAAEDIFLSTQLETSRTTIWSPTKRSTRPHVSFEEKSPSATPKQSKRSEPAGLTHPKKVDLFSSFSFSARTDRSDSGAEGDEPPKNTRTIEVGIPNYIPDDEYSSNAVITAKYNVLTFLPIFLFKMFSRVAYLYFLFQAGLTFWQAISPYKPWGPTIALLFVLTVAAIKEIIEDRKRHQADLMTNTSITHILQPDGSFSEKEWQQVKVGDIIQVNDDDLLPADLLCLHTALPDQVCFVKTANLDGESNLKIKRPVTLLQSEGSHRSNEEEFQEEEGPASPPLTSPGTYRKEFMPLDWMTAIFKTKATVQVEPPSKNLQSMCGYVESGHSAEMGTPVQEENNVVPITMNEMLLRGCMLKNSGFVLGLVVYTGNETRIQMNNRHVPFKLGSFDAYLNMQIILLLFLQFSICLGMSIAGMLWRSEQGIFRYYLAYNDYNWESNNENDFLFVLLNVMTNWILYSYMIPISLFVSNEIVKFWQTFIYINKDDDMVDPVTEEPARSRNSNVVEDLGKIDCVFSDKTGTLTSNEMRLRAIGIGGLKFGSKDRQLEHKPELSGKDALEFFDEDLAKSLLHLKKSEPWASTQSEDNSKYDYVTVRKHVKSGKLGPEDGESCIDYEKLGEILYEFFLSLCICHSLIVEGGEENPSYQGPSPDEVALVEAAKQLGFEFVQRSSKHVKLGFHGHSFNFEILNVMEFSSERRKMSVIARGPDGVIRLFCKGADSAIMECLRKYHFLPDGDDLMKDTNQNLTDFACQGLRTLCVANKILSEEYWEEWDAKYQEAAACIDDRDAKTASCAKELETDLNLLGITAIEDKLQDGVPETIELLANAGIKVFMITGDKQETAISIAISCNLIQSSSTAMVCNENSPKDAKRKLKEFLKDCDQAKYYTSTSATAMSCDTERKELVIDGPTLNHIVGTEIERLFAELASRCASVVICRSSPSQKSAIVRIMKEYQMYSHSRWYKTKEEMPWYAKFWYKSLWKVWDGRALAIGDGANDVAMLQSADVGIGILGKEGRQAVNNSDFAIGQFRFLGKLLLVHGQLSYYRLAHLIKYSFYKNISFAMVYFYYQFFCGFSSVAVIDSIKAMIFNVVLSSVPILVLAAVDKPAGMGTLLKYPQTYNTSRAMSNWNFWKAALLKSILTSSLSFFVPYFSSSTNGRFGTEDIHSLGTCMYIALLGIIGIEIMMLSKSWTWIFVIAVGLSYVLVYIFLPLWTALLKAFNWPESTYAGIAESLFVSPSFWLQLLLCYLIAFGFRFIDRAVKLHFFPEDYDLLAEVRLRKRIKKMKSKPLIQLPALGISREAKPMDAKDSEKAKV